MEIIPNVHLIPGIIANPYLIVSSDGLTLIDTGIRGSDRKILKYIAELGRAPADLKRIVITHSDGDHVGSLSALKAASGARVYASRVEAEAIRAGRQSRPLKTRGLQRLLMKLIGPFLKAQPAAVDEVIAGGQTLPILDGLQVIETPGHTPGHISLFAPSARILFGGDSMIAMNGALRESRGYNTWDEAKAIESARAQAALGAQIVCVGHGSVVQAAAGKFPRV
ncbi:MAG TPA: MBL fold metallo-hydrolase [Anaerolineae bacterium]|nr:MBL fold metallo-hydrolase [Anaerolineae bacterium]